MKKAALSAIFIGILAVAASAQSQCATIDECNALVTRLTQALNKTLDVNKANEGLIAAQKDQIAAQERLIAVKDAVAKEQDKLIEFYRKQTCDRTSFLWGIIKTTRCSVR